ncbi:MAG: tetratricopeptide repeat protein [Nitrospirae bacterium]|nr:tetratricopeptide repeat protein [Nitrospirota bacterium]
MFKGLNFRWTWGWLLVPFLASPHAALAAPAAAPSAEIEQADEHLRQAVHLLGELLEAGTLPQEKHALLKALIESQPAQPLFQYYSGLLLRAEGRWNDAVAQFKAAARGRPDLGADRFIERGTRLESAGREGQAIVEYTTALQLDESIDTLRLRLAQLLIQRHDHDSAERHLGILRSRRSLEPQVYTLLGQISLERGQTERAIGHLEVALAKDPRLSPALVLLARAYKTAGRLEQALDAYERALPAFPSDRTLQTEADEIRGAVARLREEREKINYPNVLVDIGGSQPYALVVEKSTQRLFLYKQHLSGEIERVAEYPTTTGRMSGDKRTRGDERTPEGIYFFTTRIPGERLEPRFGAMAFPMNYPNEIDTWLGKSGGGIWLHGVDRKEEERPPFNSRGCVVVRNSTLSALAQFLSIHMTPIAVTDRLTFAGREKSLRDRAQLRRTVEGWAKAWEKGDLNAYMAFYSDRFQALGRNKAQWRAYKSRIFEAKSDVRIGMEELKLLRYAEPPPLGAQEIVVAQYVQNYQSDDLRDVGVKRIYLTKEGAEYRILTESWMPYRPVEPFPLVGAGLLEPE